MYNFGRALIASVAVTSLLVACGGGGSESVALSTPTYLNGFAAMGAAVSNGNVTAKCVAGPPLTTSSDSSGAFTLTLTASHSAPCMLQITGGSLGASQLHGFAGATGRVNLTPITDLIVSKALGSNPSTVFTAFSTSNSNLISSNLTAAKSYVNAQIASITNASVTIDPLNGVFVVGDSNDRVLDSLGTALTVANQTLDGLRTVAQTGGDLTTVVPNPNVLSAMVGTYDSGCVKTNVGSAKYTLVVSNPTGTDVAKVSLRAQIFENTKNTVANFVSSGNSLIASGFLYGMPIYLPTAGTCTTTSTDMSIGGQITALSTKEAYLGTFAGVADQWADQVSFRIDSATFAMGSLNVPVPTFGTTGTLGYKILNNKFYFVSGTGYGSCPTASIAGLATTSCRYIDPTYLTKQ
jgi:hypothetical protein